jgi:hypothetical protein
MAMIFCIYISSTLCIKGVKYMFQKGTVVARGLDEGENFLKVAVDFAPVVQTFFLYIY